MAILKRVAEEKGTFYKLASKKEEARGIDGYIGYTPVSIKPLTYTAKKGLVEEISVQIIYYEKTRSGLVIHYDF